MSLLSCARKASVVMEWEEKPITAKCGESSRSLAKLHNAGISLRFVRSPPAPKITITQGLACCPCSSKPSVIFVRSGISSPVPGHSLGGRGLLQVPAKLKSHRGQKLRRKIVFPARDKALKERCREHGCRRRRFDGCKDRPASLPGIRYPSGKSLKGWLLQQRNRRQVKQPTGHHTASPPHFGHIGQRKVIAVVLRIA